MNYHLEAHRQIRENLLKILKSFSVEDLLYIPDGFNNHIFWNIAHCVATQQLLHYYLTDNDFRIDKSWIDKYKKGTLPNFDVEISDIEDLILLLRETSKQLKEDYEEGYFGFYYQSYTTSFGIELKNIQEAIAFNNMHESLHLGYATALSKAIMAEKGEAF
ncbi:MAG: DinB family protein [Flavobacteriaceae bacterium]|nr:DinB family protein [Flavobacteriaceae bacterium]